MNRSLLPFRQLFSLLLLLAPLTMAACSSSDADPPTCGTGTEACGGTCVDTAADPAHCGGCGLACAEGESCEDGSCVLSCPHGKTACGESCVDLRSDAANCGSCGAACEEGAVCSTGSCAEQCEADETLCGASCVRSSSNPNHCGACDQACDEGQACEDGACTTCSVGLTLCEGACVDTEAEAAHCGTCGNACMGGRICADGTCACPEGHEVCDGICVDTLSDADNCGECGETCDPDRVCADSTCVCEGALLECGGICLDGGSDDENCGSCGTSCDGQPNAESGSCQGGTCRLFCEEHFLDCDPLAPGCETDARSTDTACGSCTRDCTNLPNALPGTCDFGSCDFVCVEDRGECDGNPDNGCETNLLLHQNHCGTCDNDCAALPKVLRTECEDGGCKILECEEGWDDCDGDPANGCEVELATDKDHCGACTQVCGAYCSDGSCTNIEKLAERGSNHHCVILTDKSVYCWGSHTSRQIGIPASDTYVVHPAKVQDISAGTPVLADQVGVGSAFTCALLTDSRVACWGANDWRQLGTPASGNSAVPVIVQDHAGGALSDVKQLGVGASFACALLNDGRVKCWGSNFQGQLGVNDALLEESSTARVVVQSDAQPQQALGGVQSIAVGSDFACALLNGSAIKCWGSNQWGKLGIGTDTGKRAAPVDGPSIASVQKLVAGSDVTCALVQGGSVQCWGYNGYGQVGDDSTTNRPDPVSVVGLSGAATDLFAGGGHMCALVSQRAECWGRNNMKQIWEPAGNAQRTATPILEQKDGAPLSPVKAVVGGTLSTCLLKTDGNLLCMGSNNYGELAIGAQDTSPHPNPAPIQWHPAP